MIKLNILLLDSRNTFTDNIKVYPDIQFYVKVMDAKKSRRRNLSRMYHQIHTIGGYIDPNMMFLVK